MHRPDDSSLELADLMAIEKRSKGLLDRAEAWDRFPTPIEDILSAAKLKVAPKSMFDPAHIMDFIKTKGAAAVDKIKSAISKVLGIYDANENIIHIDDDVTQSKQTFLKLHETGHHEIPTHKKIFSIFQDCEKTLAPHVADQFEREANNFARYALFQGDKFKSMAADMSMSIKTPMNLSKKFGASIYASAREFARTHHRPCVVYVLEPLVHIPGVGAKADVRRVEASTAFHIQFGAPTDTVIDTNHALANLLPIGRKMTRATPLVYLDRNGQKHECLGEAFDTTYNILILIYPIQALTKSSIIVPASFGIQLN